MLSAIVMHKFEHAATTWWNVGVYNLDELSDLNCSVFTRLLRQCSLIEQNTTCSLFMFLSPQFLNNHHDALDVFVSCVHERTLQLIAVDEVHIHIQHGWRSTMIFELYGPSSFYEYLAVNPPINAHA